MDSEPVPAMYARGGWNRKHESHTGARGRMTNWTNNRSTAGADERGPLGPAVGGTLAWAGLATKAYSKKCARHRSGISTKNMHHICELGSFSHWRVVGIGLTK